MSEFGKAIAYYNKAISKKATEANTYFALGNYDVLSLDPNQFGLEEIWFDVNQSLNFLNDSFK